MTYKENDKEISKHSFEGEISKLSFVLTLKHLSNISI